MGELGHTLIWGWCRLLLATVQLTCAPLAAYTVFAAGLDNPVSLTLFAAATLAAIVSRLLYRGRPDPRLARRTSSKNIEV